MTKHKFWKFATLTTEWHLRHLIRLTRDMTSPTRRHIQRHRHEMLTLETIETWQLRVTLECIWFFSMFSRRPINLKFLCKPKLESECAKVGQISSEIRLIACQKHLYGASKNINFILLHHGRIFVYWNHLWPYFFKLLILLGWGIDESSKSKIESRKRNVKFSSRISRVEREIWNSYFEFESIKRYLKILSWIQV